MFNMGSAPSLADIAAVTKDGNGEMAGVARDEMERTAIFREDLIPSQSLTSLAALTMEFVMVSML